MIKDNYNKNNSVYLKVAEVEYILQSCIYGASFSEIYSSLQKILPVSEVVLRKYIYYLISNSFIFYDGIKKLYFIDAGGLELLEVIYAQVEKRIVDYTDLMIRIE